MPGPPAPQLPATPATPAAASGSRPATWQDLIAAEATKQGIDPRLATAVASSESDFNPQAISKAGARGLMQLMPATAARHGVNIDDPVENIRGGVAELKQLLDQHQGDVVMALRRYNASAAAGPEVTEPYVQRVLGRLQQGQGQAGPQTQPASAMSQRPGGPPLMAAHGAAGPPAPPETWTQWGWRHVKEAASAFDPREAEGRRNLAGAAGAGLATAGLVATAPVSAPIGAGAALLGGVAGAAGGGMLAEAGEQIAGTKPVSSSAVGLAGAQQGAYEGVGQVVPWAAKAAGRRFTASSIGQAASAGLRNWRQLTTAQLEDALATATEAGHALKGRAASTVQAARTTAAQGLQTARRGAAAGVAQAEKTGEADLALQQGRYAAHAAGGPPPEMAGRAASAVMEGPAQSTRDMVGQAVDRTAREGPPVDIRKLKASAQAVLEKISPPQQSFPRVAATGAGAESEMGALAARGINVENLRFATPQRSPLALPAQALADAQTAAAQETLKHPAMAVVSRILNAEDTVPFHAAHLWKRELQDALSGTYDKTVKKQATSITQHLAGELRQALAGHEPYNQATAAYAKIIPLYTKEYAARIKKTALTDPEALVRMIDPKKPTAAGMLRDLLVEMPKADGPEGAAQGQEAWDLLRGAWTKSKLLTGGIETLGAKLDKLPGEFTDQFFHDAHGKEVLQNLRTLADAYAQAQLRSGQGVELARATGQVGVQAAQAEGRAGVQAAQRTAGQMKQEGLAGVSTAREALSQARKPTPDEIKFAASSLAKRHTTPEQVAADAVRAAALGPGSLWGALSMMRLLKGPRERDLLEWAVYSSANTQTLVKLLTGANVSGQALANVVRASGILTPSHDQAPVRGPNAPPTRALSGPPPDRR